jgi:recombinational DNA repair protein (RecF pathway)
VKTEIILGIVIKSTNFGEKAARVTVFSKEGTQTFNCKFRAALQLFTIAEFTVTGHTIIGVYMINPCFEITKKKKKYYKACEICEDILKLNPAPCIETAELFLETIERIESLNNI